MSGSDAPEAEVSESAKQQAFESAAKYEEWRDDGYQQLELDALNEAQKDYSGYMQGRASADVAAGARGMPAQSMAATGGQVLGMDASGRNIAGAFATAQQDARVSAQNLQLQHQMTAAGVGNDVAAQSANALNSMAATSTNNALQQLKNESTIQQSRNQIAQSALQGAMYGGAQKLGASTTKGMGDIDWGKFAGSSFSTSGLSGF